MTDFVEQILMQIKVFEVIRIVACDYTFYDFKYIERGGFIDWVGGYNNARCSNSNILWQLSASGYRVQPLENAVHTSRGEP